VVEADSRRFHDHAVAFERDRRRDRALQLTGYRVLRITHRQLEDDWDAIARAIRSLLERAQNGWLAR
jgi:very-short-patch-repair endonuclease